MKFNKYEFKEYKPRYKEMFESEKERLKRLFPNAEIEHIGSTAIEGLGGKGIIDINLGMEKSQIQEAIKKLKENNYSLIKSGNNNERWFFEKDYTNKGKVQRFNVHLTILNSETWKKCILFRDALRKNKKLCEEYSKIKKQAMEEGLENDEYKNYKKRFIQEVVENVK